jgi:hypothetical protein
VSLFGEAKNGIRQIIVEQGGQKASRVVLYGSGDLAELTFHALESIGVAVIGICSESEQKPAGDWCGRELLNPTQIKYLAPDAVVIADPDRSEQIYQSLLSLRDRRIRLIRLHATENGSRPGDSKPSGELAQDPIF